MKIFIISWTVQKWFSEKVCLNMKRKKRSSLDMEETMEKISLELKEIQPFSINAYWGKCSH